MKDISLQNKKYRKWINLIRKRKEKQTQEKINNNGYMDVDDYGTILLPDDFQWKQKPNHKNGSFYGFKGWADNFRSLIESLPPYVNPVNIIAGRHYVFLNSYKEGPNWNPDYDYDHLKEDQQKYDIRSGIGAAHHFSGDVKIGLELGWGGLLKKVRKYADLRGINKEKEEFYQAEEQVIIGIQNWIKNTVEKIDQMIKKEENPDYRDNLIKMKKVNQNIIDNHPSTLLEACQWIAWFNMASRTYNRDGAGGQLDVLLQPYYEKDMKRGLINDQEVIYYLACLLINDPNYYQLSGPGIYGEDLTCDMSYLILEAAHCLKSSCNLTVAYHKKIDKEFFLQSVKYLIKDKKGWPRYCGHDSLSKGFIKNGYPVELGRQRKEVGCNWMAIPGREYTINDTIKINIARVFEIALKEMFTSERKHSIEKLWQLFKKHLKKAVLCTARGIDWHLKYLKYSSPELVLNLFCYGPVEKGQDISDGGVETYNIGVDGCGLATVADSLAALETRIEKEKALDWDTLKFCLENNYDIKEGEKIRNMLKNSPKYGQGNSSGDKWALKVSDLFTELIKQDSTPEGINMIPGWFSWSLTINLGKKVGATPNGRKAGEPISFGANPDPGFRKDGALTAMSNAIASIQPGYGNTAPFQLELDPGSLNINNEDDIKKIASLIKEHFELGGTLLNANIIDAETILDANENPEKYPDLIVRVTGFTAYFASLSPEFRQLVVNRIVKR